MIDSVIVDNISVTTQHANDNFSVVEVIARLSVHGTPQAMNVQKISDTLAGALIESEVCRGE
jgi:hypothetical protein